MPARAETLVLVPTELERRALLALGGFEDARVELAGFGPVAAAARSAQLLGRLAPARVVLVGIAGAFDPERHPIASALVLSAVALDGVGAGEGAARKSAAELGFPHWPGSDDACPEPIGDRLPLAFPAGSGAGLLLTVAAASDSSAMARARRARFPAAVAEDMEGFGVAVACALERVPLTIVRGLSNAVGERDVRAWRIEPALAAARALALPLLARAPSAGGDGRGRPR